MLSYISSLIYIGPIYLPFVYVLMLLVIFILPFFSVDEYSILKNTTSHLGAQGAPSAWIMNLVFALLGISAIIDSYSRLKGYPVHKVVIVIFGASLIFTAFFQHAPIVTGAAFSETEDTLHSIFASTTGFSFVFFAISSAFIESTGKRRIIAFGAGIFATLLSVLIFSVPDLAGIWQRMMFITTFAWLIFFLYPRKIQAS